MRRSRVLAAAAVVVTAGAVTALVLTGAAASGEDDATDDTTAPTATAEITRRDLVEREELDGTLGFGQIADLTLGGQGTLTALPAEGATVGQGQPIAEVDGRPVVLLLGARPMWRSLGEGVEAGADIRQLEENLIALGHGTAAQLGPNETWSAATTSAVKRWQDSLGVPETGAVDRGSVVFLLAPVRIASQLAPIGAGAGGPVVAVSGLAQLVTVDAPANRPGLLEVGQAVDVELPNGTVVPATVQSVATVVDQPAQEQGGDATVAVVIALDDPTAAGSLDQAPVDVRITDTTAADVLTVPVDALLALAEGGYAVERETSSGTTELVGVEVGAFADGFVEIRGTTADLAEGDAVVVPG